MDLKIEIRKLYALHKATILFDHGIRDTGKDIWVNFAPSRFIYAFFTFDSIYSWNWSASYESKKAIKWSKGDNGHMPDEERQFKAYLKYIDEVLAPDTPARFSEELSKLLIMYGVTQPIEDLQEVNLVNADKRLRGLARQLPIEFERLWHGKATGKQFYSSACPVFNFIYRVRCNLFHGSKTMLGLLDARQQQRLKIYTATVSYTHLTLPTSDLV